jgi:2'-5' RNA ligase
MWNARRECRQYGSEFPCGLKLGLLRRDVLDTARWAGVPLELGQSAVVVPVPAVEPVVAHCRARFDASAAQGMPAHITTLYPFLAERRLTAAAVADLVAVCGEHDPFEVTFARTARFAGVLYLDPEPAEPLRELTLAVASRWPEAPPYGGIHDQVIPHLTVAHEQDPVLDAVDAELRPRLPLVATLDEARLYVFDGLRWRERVRLPFRSDSR